MKEKPFAHQQWLAGHLAKRKLDTDGTPAVWSDNDVEARLKTPTGKPVIVNQFTHPEMGQRIGVSRGSQATGDLVAYQTVAVEPVREGSMPEIHPASTADQAQAIIDDLRAAK